MNGIWLGISLISLIYGLVTGRIEVLASAILDIPQKGLELAVTLVFSAVFWNGMMCILSDVGAIGFISKLLRPLLHLIMPELKDKETIDLISTNIAANMLGLGFAATPSGLKAMKRMKQLSLEEDNTASDEMVTFLVLNTAGVTLIPTSVLAIRQSFGSANPADFVILGIISTLLSCISGLYLDHVLKSHRKKKRIKESKNAS